MEREAGEDVTLYPAEGEEDLFAYLESLAFCRTTTSCWPQREALMLDVGKEGQSLHLTLKENCLSIFDYRRRPMVEEYYCPGGIDWNYITSFFPSYG